MYTKSGEGEKEKVVKATKLILCSKEKVFSPNLGFRIFLFLQTMDSDVFQVSQKCCVQNPLKILQYRSIKKTVVSKKKNLRKKWDRNIPFTSNHQSPPPSPPSAIETSRDQCRSWYQLSPIQSPFLATHQYPGCQIMLEAVNPQFCPWFSCNNVIISGCSRSMACHASPLHP